MSKFDKKSRKHSDKTEEWYDSFGKEVDRIPAVPSGKLEQLWISIEGKLAHRVRVRRMVRFSSIAAGIMLLVGTGAIFFRSADTKKAGVEIASVGEILPANGVAVLRLSNGQQIRLDRKEMIQEGKDVFIKNDSSDVLDYSEIVTGQDDEVLYNTIVVPVGGEYRVVLADGTRVRLNSCSLLTYPISFQDETRVVTLKGEAYFEVTKSTKPFIVNTSNLSVKVLGTSFNVSDYSDDNIATTTLIEGRVKVREQGHEKEYDITPGYTLEYNKERELVCLQDKSPEKYIAWLDGKLRFEGMRLEDIMRLLKRWYDCDIEYEDERLKNLHYSGMAEKDRPVNYLLHMIEEVTDVKFVIEGKKVKMYWEN